MTPQLRLLACRQRMQPGQASDSFLGKPLQAIKLLGVGGAFGAVEVSVCERLGESRCIRRIEGDGDENSAFGLDGHSGAFPLELTDAIRRRSRHAAVDLAKQELQPMLERAGIHLRRDRTSRHGRSGRLLGVALGVKGATSLPS